MGDLKSFPSVLWFAQRCAMSNKSLYAFLHSKYYTLHSFIHYRSLISPLCAFTWLTPPALQSHNLSGEGINSGSHTSFLWIHKDKEGLPGWRISSIPGPPQRQHEHERQYTPVTHSFILTRRIWKDGYVGLVGLKPPDICLTGEEKPRKT